MRLSLFAVALAALPSVFAGGGAWIINRCPFTVYFYADGPGGRQGPPGTILGGSDYREDYQGEGRVIKLSQSPLFSSVLVFGYSKPDNAPLVWASLNDVGGHPFAGDRIVLIGSGNAPDCTPVTWPNGVSDDPSGSGTRVIACTPAAGLFVVLCADDLDK